MKPYIEHDGKTYEFEANFTLKREYDREYQSLVRNAIVEQGISEKQYNEYKEIANFIEQNKDENSFDRLTNKQKETLSQMFSLIENLTFVSLYEKYCYKMLNAKYNITQKEYETMLEGLAEEYGISFVDTFVQKVCEKVFTQTVEKKQQEKKTLPQWMN